MPSDFPNLKLEKREKPYQKITVKKLPAALHDQLETKARGLNKKLPVYCRIVLEHALENSNLYEGETLKSYDTGDSYAPGELNIPVQGTLFLEKIKKWDPWGDEHSNRIAIAILTRHLNREEIDW